MARSSWHRHCPAKASNRRCIAQILQEAAEIYVVGLIDICSNSAPISSSPKYCCWPEALSLLCCCISGFGCGVGCERTGVGHSAENVMTGRRLFMYSVPFFISVDIGPCSRARLPGTRLYQDKSLEERVQPPIHKPAVETQAYLSSAEAILPRRSFVPPCEVFRDVTFYQ